MASTMKGKIQINGYTFRVKNIDILSETIWSDSTGRSSDGKIIGDVVCEKYKLEVTFPPLSEEEAINLKKACTTGFYPVKFYDYYTGQDVTIPMYNGELRLSPYSALEIFKYVQFQGVTVHLIEQ